MNRLRIFTITLSAATLLCLQGCNERPGSKILAKVNGRPLTVDDVSFRLQQAHGKQPQYGKKSIDDIINQELLFQQGMRLGLDQDPSYRRIAVELNNMPAGAKRLEMARRVFNSEIASKIEVRPRDGKEYYEKNADRIATELHLEWLKFDERAKAEKALKKLRQGVDFATLARPAMKGAPVQGREPWDLGFVKWEQVPVDFLDQIYKLNPGEVSEVLGSQPTGFQIVRLIEKRKTPNFGYDKVSTKVMNQLRDLKLLQAYGQYLDKLRKEAQIVTF